jgi:hypothetical protein
MTSSFNSLSSVQKRLLVLLQYALWGKEVEANLFEEVSHTGWLEVMELAAIQGVFGLAYDGLKGLSDACKPPRGLLIQWTLGVKQIEGRHHLHLNVLQSLAEFYKKNGIRCLLLKGLGISQFYPVPKHRESGDLDLYLFGDYDKGNLLMEENGIKVDYQDEVHSKFFFDQVPVENHISFTQIKRGQSNREIEQILYQILLKEEPQLSENLRIYIPSLSFNLLFLHNHAVKHFLGSGIVLRQLCDWALLLHNCRNNDDYPSFYETAGRFDLHHYADAFSLIAVEYLGLPENRLFTANQDRSLIQKVFSNIMDQKRIYPFPPRRNLMEMLTGKSKGAVFLFKSRWKYEAVNHKMFFQELMLRLRYCSQIFSSIKR